MKLDEILGKTLEKKIPKFPYIRSEIFLEIKDKDILIPNISFDWPKKGPAYDYYYSSERRSCEPGELVVHFQAQEQEVITIYEKIRSLGSENIVIWEECGGKFTHETKMQGFLQRWDSTITGYGTVKAKLTFHICDLKHFHHMS
jgi:hypothetical protein